ncbi:SCO4226 family nickel-binding protein [Streptomyces sp. NPDC046261]|uniref:SCO4226 family nickel-binding protein n=1 Tax=Streptomyces sp. NPDC046261 TaxID=3157200 RepID=UPI0033C6B775
MTKFMDVHHGMQGITKDQLATAHRADQAIEREEGVHFEHAWADPKSGTVYCLSEAPSADAVKRIHERAGHPVDEVHQVPLEIS